MPAAPQTGFCISTRINPVQQLGRASINFYPQACAFTKDNANNSTPQYALFLLLLPVNIMKCAEKKSIHAFGKAQYSARTTLTPCKSKAAHRAGNRLTKLATEATDQEHFHNRSPRYW